MGFVYTTAIKKLRKLTKKIRVVPGGTSAGKTFGILPILIDTAARTPNLEISVVSESVPHLRRGALKDFKKIMRITGRWIEAHYNKTMLTYTFANGSYIEFFSVEDEAKVRGARRDILYVNECNNVLFNTYHQLAIRTRLNIWLDFNPSGEFWAHTELTNTKKTEWLTLTYADNEALDKSIREEIEEAREKGKTSEYWANWWKVYGLGQLGTLQGAIYENWTQINGVPAEAKLMGYGLDFGYTNDPLALVALYKYGDKIIVDELIYLTGLSNKEIIDCFIANNVRKDKIIIADSSDPKTIKELASYGYVIKGAVKGPGSVNFGIGILQDYEMLITTRSLNVIKELRRYLWETTKSGESLNVPIDKFNHAMDALRYVASKVLGKRRAVKKTIKLRN